MELYESVLKLAENIGWQPDTVLLIFGFFTAVYWIVSLIGCGLAVALWIIAFRRLRLWWSSRQKK